MEGRFSILRNASTSSSHLKMEFHFQSNSVMNSLKCPKSKSLSHCLTELFPIYQNKHWTIRWRDNRSVNHSHKIAGVNETKKTLAPLWIKRGREGNLCASLHTCIYIFQSSSHHLMEFFKIYEYRLVPCSSIWTQIRVSVNLEFLSKFSTFGNRL